ncbi:MAG: NifB/NifX family molybdenum-iron cluster-binding protein [Longimicrobiales bacterium]
MKICIPTMDEEGLGARLSAHFGQAPYYTVVDTDGWTLRTIINTNEHHAHGQCTPVASIRGLGVDAVVCRGLGRNALAKLRAAGLTVYVAEDLLVEDAVKAFVAGDLSELTDEEACHGHGHGHGHGHEHGHEHSHGHRHQRLHDLN